MHAERDHLRRFVFPALEERLRGRRRHLEWVDLRLGVATAVLEEGEQRELQVLKVCLGEVQRCRPFLIVLLGDRYGWVPPPERISAAATEQGFGGDVAGRSVTDLEISFGVLRNPEQQPRSLFYFRDPLPYAAMAPERAALFSDAHDSDPKAVDRSRRLAALKAEIKAQLPDRVCHYAAAWDESRQCVTGLDAWGQAVIEDLWSELAAETSCAEIEPEFSWQQIERQALDDYVEDRARDFVGRRQILSRLDALAASPAQQGGAWGLCLIGAPGSGKSAIFGELHRRLQQGSEFVLAHATAASARAPSVDDMLRRWIEELAAALGTPSGLAGNANPETIESTFYDLLRRMTVQRRVVVLLDALDQFEATTRGRFLTWLPRDWPANARLIATAIPGEASTALGGRAGVETLALPPLDSDEAREIANRICTRYHRTLEPSVLDALLNKSGQDGPAWHNTLWLVLAVEELNLVDADDFARATRTYSGAPAEQIRALMLDIVTELSGDVPGLYRQTFERAEKVLSVLSTRPFLGFIAVSRAGWRETDFKALLSRHSDEPWDELRFASLRRLYRGQVRQYGSLAQWDFNHAQMRAATRQCLAAQNAPEAEFHAEIADHLLSLPVDDPLRESETMVHLLGSRDWSRAASYYGRASLTQRELDGATRVLAGVVLAKRREGDSEGLDQALRLLDASTDNQIVGTVATRLLFDLDDLIRDRAGLADGVKLFNAIGKTLDRLVKSDAGHIGWLRDLGVSRNRIGDILRAQGNLPVALENYRAALFIKESLLKTDPENGEWQRDLASAQERIGDVLFDQGNLGAALESYRIALAIADRLVKADPGNAGWQRILAGSHQRVGEVLVEQGNLAAALDSYGCSLAIAYGLAEADPASAMGQRYLSVAQDGIGDVLRAHGNLPEALEHYRASLAVRDRLAKADPGNDTWQNDLGVSHAKIGGVFSALGNLPAAFDSYQASLVIRDRLAKTDPGNGEWQSRLAESLESIGGVFFEQGDLAAALRSHRASLTIRDGLAEADPGNAGWQRDVAASRGSIGGILFEMGNLPAALENYRASLAIVDRLANAHPGNAARQRGLSLSHAKVGGVLHAEGNLVGALDSYQTALAIAYRLANADPQNGEWQRDLSALYGAIGDLQRDQSNLTAALESYSASLAIAERLAEANPANAGWQRDLSMWQERIGDLFFAQGNLGEALKNYQASLAIADRLAKTDPANVEWQRGLAVCYGRLATVVARWGDRQLALIGFRKAREIIARLIAWAPDYQALRKDLSWFEARIADLESLDDR
jgi:tetratricopeptide (TPR) repeat protein